MNFETIKEGQIYLTSTESVHQETLEPLNYKRVKVVKATDEGEIICKVYLSRINKSVDLPFSINELKEIEPHD